MLKNYFKTALRHFKRNKIFSVINISGLSIGLACCMLIILYAKDETSFDRFHKNADNLYQLTCDRIEKEGTDEKFGIAAMVQGPAFKKEIPEIREFTRVNNKVLVVKKGDAVFNEQVTWADDNFFSVFSFPLISGGANRALADMHSIVLTDEMAVKYFGNTDVVGKTLTFQINGNSEPFVISGIAKKPPQNSSIQFNIVMPFKFLEKENPDNGWMWVSYPTYFLLDPGANIRAIKAKMEQVYQTQAKNEIDLNHLAGYDNKFVWDLKPLIQMHLDNSFQGTPGASNPIYAYILSGIAIFILIIACINFVNLTIAQSLKRAKEIGIRKVIGGLRNQLIRQFLGESFLVSFLAFAIAIILAQFSLPIFNDLANKQLSLSYLLDFKLAAGFIILFFITGFAAGFYPALVVSGFNPVQTLYNRSAHQGKNFLSGVLVIFQFALAIFLIIATIFIYNQFNFLTKTNLGYNDRNLVQFVTDKAVMNKPLMDQYKSEFFKVPGVENVSYKNVGKFGGKTMAGSKEFNADYERIDDDYLAALQAKLIAGRSFSKGFPADITNSVLINEAFVQAVGWKNPIGKTVDYMNLPGWGSRKVNVIGVVKDYHYESLKEKIRPQLFTQDAALPLGQFLIRLKEGRTATALAALEKTYSKMIPNHPFDYVFSDEMNKRNYDAEHKWKQIITFSATITIFISCIGLLGLTILSTEKRRKEIGIRKVLGATTNHITQLIALNFIKLVFIAFLIAVPISWFVINKWLQSFAYRIEMSWYLFALAGTLALVIALLTVGSQVVRIARSQPVKALKTE